MSIKRIITILIPIILILSILIPPSLFARQSGGLSLSGVFESSVMVNGSVNKSDNFNASYGLEEYSNIRMQSRVGDKAVFFGAVNLIAATGDYARRLMTMDGDSVMRLPMSVAAGENYVAGIELERLQFRFKGEQFDFNAGLMRMPFGYGLAWKPSDFLNPPNPLNPSARPRAVLGGTVTYYPIDELKLQGFATTGRDPMSNNSGLAGMSVDKHWSNASVQLLYAIEHSDQFPATDSSKCTHRAGASLKADIEIGFVAEMLYVYNESLKKDIDGLSLSAGFDYSLFRGNLILLAEYLYNGAASSTSIQGGGSFINEHNLITGATWQFSDFTNISLQLITDLDEKAIIPMVTFNSEISQGVTLSLMAQAMPDDRHFLFETKLKLKF